MSGTSCFRVIGNGGHIVSNAVPLSRDQSTTIAHCFQLCIGNMLNAFEIIFELSPKLIDGADDRLGGGQQGVVGFVLFVT